MTNDDQCAKGFLIDCPSPEDRFASKGHKKIAEAVSKWIQNGEGANAIALECGLGSGKSSVVEMAKELLGEKEQHWFCTFDLFLHKNDYVRRAFLEHLIEFVKKRGSSAADNEALDDIKKRVTSKKTIVEKDQRIKLAPSGLIVSGLFALIMMLLSSLSTSFVGFPVKLTGQK